MVGPHGAAPPLLHQSWDAIGQSAGMSQDTAALIAHWQRQRMNHPAYQGFFWNGTIPLDDAARKGLTLRRIDRWREAVELQHERLTQQGNRHIPDIHFYVIAADNLADAVRGILSQYPE